MLKINMRPQRLAVAGVAQIHHFFVPRDEIVQAATPWSGRANRPTIGELKKVRGLTS
jgi:hypothetical protein